jgi:hypothetical protein
MRESVIERRLRQLVWRYGGMALKFTSPGFTGVPDRLVLMPSGRIAFAELKSTIGILSGRQKIVRRDLQDLGFPVYVINSTETLSQFENEFLKQ